jgi:hypothetical protein
MEYMTTPREAAASIRLDLVANQEVDPRRRRAKICQELLERADRIAEAASKLAMQAMEERDAQHAQWRAEASARLASAANYIADVASHIRSID